MNNVGMTIYTRKDEPNYRIEKAIVWYRQNKHISLKISPLLGGAKMIFADHLKFLDKLFDKISKSKISAKRKDILLTVITISIIIERFCVLLLIKHLTDIVGGLLS